MPAGTKLTRHYGDMVVTRAGATYVGLDIHGFLTIKAPNVTVKNSIIRGGVATVGSNIGIVNDITATATDFVLKDSELVPEHPSVAIDGIKGWNYTLLRDNIHGTVDGAKVFGDNATIQDSWLHDTVHYLVDPNQGKTPSHNDGVQVLSGNNIFILNNTITNSNNSALQVTQDHGAVSNLWFDGNRADGGGCTVNLNNKPLASMKGIAVNGNRFGHHTRIPDCPIIVTRGTGLTADGNVFDDTGLPAPVRDGG